MIKYLKNKLRGFISNSIPIQNIPQIQDNRYSPETKIALRNMYHYYQECAKKKEKINLSDTGFRIFSQFEEDGILLAIFGLIGEKNKTFVDIGGADGINSNCANLAINLGWNGLFIDGDQDNITKGSIFYKNHPDTWGYPPKLTKAFIQRENINQIIEDAGFNGEIDLVSIDLDGNDYWIWDALKVVSPRVVIIETHIEFGFNSIVVPYDKDYFYPGKHPDYHGASPVAMNKLANKLGYRLVGSNNYGFNTIYIKNGIAEDLLPEVSLDYILRHPRNEERFKVFEPIKDWDYITV
ncbi:MAG: hypothetical protein A2X12_07315 [Bacteroidetes bacterium GWE2_29_8]|nr:MAG: hypothetical protein A2X12_07315 [Bacteroidetes bacterium GWE2_29_8]OFY24585.1 MAG: hypothetical protein A2X02_03205 [Bacteroidetes bacterium GWF2_29_10]